MFHNEDAGMSPWWGGSLGLLGRSNLAIFIPVQRKAVKLFRSVFVVGARLVLLFTDSDLPFRLEIIAYLQQSHNDLHAQKHEYDKKDSQILWAIFLQAQ